MSTSFVAQQRKEHARQERNVNRAVSPRASALRLSPANGAFGITVPLTNVKALGAFFRSECRERVSFSDVPSILQRLGLPRDAGYVDDVWFELCGGVVAPYVTQEAFCRVFAKRIGHTQVSSRLLLPPTQSASPRVGSACDVGAADELTARRANSARRSGAPRLSRDDKKIMSRSRSQESASCSRASSTLSEKEREMLFTRLAKTNTGNVNKAAVDAKEANLRKIQAECTFSPSLSPRSRLAASRYGSRKPPLPPQKGGLSSVDDSAPHFMKYTVSKSRKLQPEADPRAAPLPTDATFRPKIHSLVELPPPQVSRGYYDTVCRMRSNASKRAEQKHFAESLREGQNSMRVSHDCSRDSGDEASPLSRPLMRIVLGDDGAALPLLPHQTDAKSLANAFCDEQGVDPTDPVRPLIERTVRHVIEQALIRDFNTKPMQRGYTHCRTPKSARK